MQNFENIEDLVAYMVENQDGEYPVSVVADKDLAIAVMKELLDYENVILSLAEVDTEYDREYIVSLYDDVDTDYWYVNINQIYDYEKDKYIGNDGYMLFHEDVNSKALLDMKNNEFIELSGYDWFMIDDEEIDETDCDGKCCCDCKDKETDDKPITTSKEIFKVNNKTVDRETYEKELAKFEDRYLDNIRDMFLRYSDFMDDWNDLLKLFY